MKKYSDKNLLKMQTKPKVSYFIPMIGYFFMMSDLSKYEKEAGLLDKNTPGGKLISRVTKKFFLILNVFFIVLMLITILTIIPQWFFWKKHILKAIKLNQQAGIYK